MLMPSSIAELRGEDFRTIRELVYRVAGIHLHDGKVNLVRSRVARRLRALELDSFRDYLERLGADESGAEVAQLVDVITTNQTSFFRENRHFDYLGGQVLPELASLRRPVRLWSAGCSTGEEAVSLGIAALEAAREVPLHDVRILATDVSARVLERARRGVYGEEAVAGMPARLVAEYFSYPRRLSPRQYRVHDRVRGMLRFARLNLMDPWPMQRPFDVIFCRNVMIYFDKATKQRLVERFWDALAPGGYLFVGHSESLGTLTHGFEYVNPAVYRRAAREAR